MLACMCGWMIACVSSLSQWLMGTRRMLRGCLAPGPGLLYGNSLEALCQQSTPLFFPLFHSFASKVDSRTHIFSQNMPAFSSSPSFLCAFSFAHFNLRHILIRLFPCSKVTSAKHSALFHASLRMADSKQHFLPPFFSHGKLLSLYNPVVWQPARPTISLCLTPSP